jgi:hypothetical protein
MVRHHQVGTTGDAQTLIRYPGRIQLCQLLFEKVKIDDAAGSDQTSAPRIEDARRHQMQLEFAKLIDDSMPGIAAPAEAQHKICALRQQISDFALSLVSPLSAYNGSDRHAMLLGYSPHFDRASYSRKSPAEPMLFYVTVDPRSGEGIEAGVA